MSLPGDTFRYLLTISAMMSVPPVLPPAIIVKPMPTPTMMLPMMVLMSLPLSRAIAWMKSAGIRSWNRLSPTDASKVA